jgi:hypothetical protein
MSSEVLLEVRNLVKDFGGLRAVNKWHDHRPDRPQRRGQDHSL